MHYCIPLALLYLAWHGWHGWHEGRAEPPRTPAPVFQYAVQLLEFEQHANPFLRSLPKTNPPGIEPIFSEEPYYIGLQNSFTRGFLVPNFFQKKLK